MLRFSIVLVVILLCFAAAPTQTHAQATEEATPADLTETFNGRGRLNNITFNYPEGWHTLGGIPVTRMVSFNILSSVRVGLRNRIDPGEEAIVMAIAGGRTDRWNELDPEATPEDVLITVLESLGDNDQFNDPAAEDMEFELVVDDVTFNGYEAVRIRYVEVPPANATEIPAGEDEIDGEFIAYAVLLDDNQFVVVLTLTSEFTFEEAQPTVESILDSIVYDEGR